MTQAPPEPPTREGLWELVGVVRQHIQIGKDGMALVHAIVGRLRTHFAEATKWLAWATQSESTCGYLLEITGKDTSPNNTKTVLIAARAAVGAWRLAHLADARADPYVAMTELMAPYSLDVAVEHFGGKQTEFRRLHNEMARHTLEHGVLAWYPSKDNAATVQALLGKFAGVSMEHMNVRGVNKSLMLAFVRRYRPALSVAEVHTVNDILSYVCVMLPAYRIAAEGYGVESIVQAAKLRPAYIRWQPPWTMAQAPPPSRAGKRRAKKRAKGPKGKGDAAAPVAEKPAPALGLGLGRGLGAFLKKAFSKKQEGSVAPAIV